MIQLAYDGSLHCGWVARHAIRLAAHPAEGTLVVCHVPDGSLEPAEIAARIDRIEVEARTRGVSIERRVGPERARSAKDVHAALQALLSRGPAQQIVCGTRVRSQRGFLAGTLSQKLLRCPDLRVVAIRVVQPGLLGNPRSFLLPLSGDARRFARLRPTFELFLHDAERVSLLRVMRAGVLYRRHLSEGRRSDLAAKGWQQIHDAMAGLQRPLPDAHWHLDGRVLVSQDWPHEILVQAAELRARMLLVGASGRSASVQAAFGDPVERILRGTPCDVGICSAP